MKKILLVDDEADLLELVAMNLESQQFDVLLANDGEAALASAFANKPDLVVLDIMMPKLDGYQVMEQLRADPRTTHTPILLLTAKGEASDRISGLEKGADDYLSKPFSPKELVLRVQNLLKRNQRPASDNLLQAGDFILNRNSLSLTLAGKPVDLTPTEFKLLRILIEGHGQPLDRDLLLREVWGYSDNALTRTLDTHVKRLREKLGTYESYIQTIRSVGYRFVLPV